MNKCQARHPLYRHLACGLEAGHKGTHHPTRSVCPILSCPEDRDPKEILCKGHWNSLPAELQARVRDTAKDKTTPDFIKARQDAFAVATLWEAGQMKERRQQMIKEILENRNTRALVVLPGANRAARRAEARRARPKNWDKAHD